MDNGPGVPPHLRDHLFEPFVTTKANGAGLGLALVAKLVAAPRRPDRFRVRARPHRLPRPPARRARRRAPSR